MARRATPWGAYLVLLAILIGGLAVRLWNIDYGLPFVWNFDENTHFTSPAVAMFRHGLEPQLYENPATFTYLVYGLLRVLYGPFASLMDLGAGNVTDQFQLDPTQIWIAARSLAAVLGMVGVVAVYAAARRIWGWREGLVAAAVLAFAFLPVTYSRIAVTDVGALTGIALALWGSVRALETGDRRVFALAGAGAGMAAAFKYTAGLALLPVGLAALFRLRRDRLGAVGWLALAVAASVAVFALLNPYFVANLHKAWNAVTDQANVVADAPKTGQIEEPLPYYLKSLTWGLGYAALAAALAGAFLELRRDVRRGVVLVALPLALLAFLAFQSRYFGRWLLPAYPALAMLAAVGVVRIAELVRGRPALRAAALVGLTAIVIAQPLAADVRTGAALGRADTREQARAWLVHRFAPELRISIEPAVPGRYYSVAPSGRLPSSLRRCPARPGWPEPGWSFPDGHGGRLCQRFRPGQFARPAGAIAATAYHLTVKPSTVDDLRFYGYCHVMVLSVVKERVELSGEPAARAYYRRLERESVPVRTFSPFDPGAKPEPFDFDLSFNLYPTAYHRPGPTVTIRRLRDCVQGYGAPAVRIPKPVDTLPAPGDEL